jgi:hypothetical protein
VITISEQVVPSAVVQCIVDKFLTNENVKAADILMRLRVDFGDKTFSRTQVYDWSNSFKEGQRLKTCEDYTSYRESYGQRFSEISVRDSSVGIALGYGLDKRGFRVRFSAGDGNFSFHHRVQNGFGAHSASYPMSIRGSFSGDKAAGA